MYKKISDFILTLNEEQKYHKDIETHKKNLEATLWGLEEQATFPENSAKNEQVAFNEQINACKLQIMGCNKLLEKHTEKILHLIQNFK